MLLPRRLIDFAEELENGNDPHATALGLRGLSELHGGVYGKVADAIRAEKDRLTDYCEVTVTVQGGRPVLTRVTTTHKPGFTSDLAPAAVLYYPPTARENVNLTGRPCFGGISMAGHGKEASLVLLFPPEEQNGMWRTLDWTATAEPGNAVNMGEFVRTVTETSIKYSPAAVGYDPFELGSVAERLTENEVRMVEVRQGARTTSQPLRFLMELMDTRRSVSDVPHVAGLGKLALREDHAGNLRPDYAKSTGISSPIGALVNAMAVAISAKPVYYKAE